MKPLVTTILRGVGSFAIGLYDAILRRREDRRQATAREVLPDAPPSTIPADRARAEYARRRRQEAARRHRETGLPEVDEAVREMLSGVRGEGER